MMRNNHKKGQKGQFLIELMVAVGVGAILIMALVNLGNASTRRATLSRQSNEATKLAQAGAEIVRSVKDASSSGGVKFAPGGRTWNDLYTTSYGNSGMSRKVQWGGGCPSGEWCLVNGEEGGLLNGVFTRRIYIRDNTPAGSSEICGDPSSGSSSDFREIKRVHVVVSWNSPTGNQEKEVVTCFAKNQ